VKNQDPYQAEIQRLDEIIEQLMGKLMIQSLWLLVGDENLLCPKLAKVYNCLALK
jgi:hypothetical protein